MTSTSRNDASTKAYIALGSNEGDRVKNIETACNELDAAGLRILRTSNLYGTKPMYVEDQDEFLNGACEVKVDGNTTPLQLLAKVKAIENKMGRHKLIEKGPRNIDLDVLLYGETTWESEQLSIPHKSMLEREFVLRPLCDLIPHHRHPHQSSKTYTQHLSSLPSSSPPMSSIVPLSKTKPELLLRPLDPKRRTLLMSILNLTPDSFSDGGHHSLSADAIALTAASHFSSGASIIDIGGQSTAPHAPQVGAKEELFRISRAVGLFPGLEALSPHGPVPYPNTAISVDTYRSTVASDVLSVVNEVPSVDIINDISGGLLDPDILPIVAKAGCTYVLSHMRGTPETMNKLTDYSSSSSASPTDSPVSGLIPVLACELLSRLAAAEAAGIRRWRIILDPGIGFAKTFSQNLEILRRLPELKAWPGLQGMPWLVGVSRKGFIGKLSDVKGPSERQWGTAAAVSAAVAGGADIVRVHDVEEMRQAVAVADGVWRRGKGED